MIKEYFNQYEYDTDYEFDVESVDDIRDERIKNVVLALTNQMMNTQSKTI